MLGLDFKPQAQEVILEKEVLETAAIEGERLDPESVRSSVAHHLGLSAAGLRSPDHKTNGVVAVLLDAARHYNKPLTEDRLKGWHATLFPDGYSGYYRIVIGDWRQEQMEVVSGPEGKHKIRYKAPPPGNVAAEMETILFWLNTYETTEYDGLLRAALAHFWFICIHPFDDGNGRIARAMTDMTLAQDEKNSTRFYNLSNQIMKKRDDYYAVLEKSSTGSGDITQWQEWFLGCFERAAVTSSQELINRVLVKGRFWHN